MNTFLKAVVYVLIIWAVVACGLNAFGDEPAQEPPANTPYFTLSQLEAGQAADLAALNKLRDRYNTAFEADKKVQALRSRIQMRQGMIDREILLRQHGVLNNKKLEKLEKTK